MTVNGLGGTWGERIGKAVAPLFAATSRARRARTFHPRGEVFHARVVRAEHVPSKHVALADRLVGHALVRFSGALWKNFERFDVLGCAIRFRREGTDDVEAAEDDQDLLLATILRPWTMGLSPVTTNARDYLGNDYYAVSPFDVSGERMFFRVRPTRARQGHDGDRGARLATSVRRGGVRVQLQLSRGPFGPWEPLVDLLLERIADVDDEALQFRPFRDGRGLTPRGFIHALRLSVYSASQAARPSHADEH